MIKLLANLGRFKTVATLTVLASVLSTLVTAISSYALNLHGFEIDFALALWFSVGVPLVVTPTLSWYLIGLLLKIHRVEQDMRKLASRDSLTGLLSRRAFFDNARSYVLLATRHKIPFSVLIVDLDHFKSINDRHGHPAGDAVLKLFADVVNSVSRRSDIIGRLGGEEFALVLPSTQIAEAFEFAERLHNAVDKAVLKHRDAMIQYTVSIGLTAVDPDIDNTIDNLLARADQALYKAKRAGRNQTAVYTRETAQFIA
jgi:diguanylate cyclase (GGDEF)-like protein